MAEDALAKGQHGGSRPGSGRPRGSKNLPKTKSTATKVPATDSVSTSTAAISASVSDPAAQPTKPQAPSKLLSGFKTRGRAIANFWATHVPQGTAAMTGTEVTIDTTPDGPVSAADALARLQIDLQTADLSQPVSERILDEDIDNGGEADEGAALLDNEVDEDDEDDEVSLDAEQQSAETPFDSVNDQWLATTLETVKKEILSLQQPQAYKDGQRRNRRIGHYNRTGIRWVNHFDIWLLDEIVETAIRLEVKPTFPEPKLLATRIATTETFGIIPITPELATAHEINILPYSNILLMPHHNDNHRYALTRFSTKPVNLYRYLQLRQRTTAAVTPVHTRREFELFQENIASFIPSNTSCTPETVYKVAKYNDFTIFWNRRVAAQSPAELDSSKRIYYKLPEQLERHHKKSIQWRTARATLNMGDNVAALEPIHALLRDPSRKAVVLPAIMRDIVEVDYNADPFVGVDLASFNPTAMRHELATQRTIEAAIAAVPTLEPPPVQPGVPPLPQPGLEQSVLVFAATGHDGDFELEELARPAKKARWGEVNQKTQRAGRRCALCAHAKHPPGELEVELEAGLLSEQARLAACEDTMSSLTRVHFEGIGMEDTRLTCVARGEPRSWARVSTRTG
ncbi:hypothetical protein C8R46DRAFT_1344713 [Mycena filopes]|nr:hypothetical protein C8R46DRAFT_1344713 [Mycena filopes]